MAQGNAAVNRRGKTDTTGHESRWVFVTTILKDHKIRLTSLPEENKEPEQKEERLASWEKMQKRHTSKGKEEAESKAGQEPKNQSENEWQEQCGQKSGACNQ